MNDIRSLTKEETLIVAGGWKDDSEGGGGDDSIEHITVTAPRLYSFSTWSGMRGTVTHSTSVSAAFTPGGIGATTTTNQSSTAPDFNHDGTADSLSDAGELYDDYVQETLDTAYGDRRKRTGRK